MDLVTILVKPLNFCMSDYHASNSFGNSYHLLLHHKFDVLKDFHILIKYAHKCKT